MVMLSVEKKVVERALSQDKVSQANPELILAHEKEWKAGEPSRVAVALEEARAVMRKEGFERGGICHALPLISVFFWSRKGILESIFLGINLVSLRGNNVVDPKDAFVMALAN